MYFAFIIATAAGAIATLAAAAVTAVLIVKRLGTLRKGTRVDYESTQHADKTAEPSSRIKQEAAKNLDEVDHGLQEERDKKGQQTHEELDPKKPGTKKGPDEKEQSSHGDVHGKEQGHQQPS